MRGEISKALLNVVRRRADTLLKSNFSSSYANIVLFFLFPGLFFYQSAIGANWIEPVIFGGWGVLVAIFCPCLVLLFFAKLSQDLQAIFTIEYFFLAFLTVISLVSIFYFVVEPSHAGRGSMLYWNIAGVISNLTCFLAFRFANFEKKSFLLLIRASAIFIALIALFNTDFDQMFFAFIRSEYLFSYQGFARSMLIVFLITFFWAKGITTRVLCYSLFVFVLVVNSSRTELILFFFAVPGVIFLKSKHTRIPKVNLLTLFGSFLIFFMIFILVKMGFLLIDDMPYMRIVGLLDPLNDPSASKRLNQTIYAFNVISENPIFGDYGNYSDGNYSHNFLSTWVNFGLLGVIIYISLLSMVAYEVLIMEVNSQNPAFIYFVAAMGVSAVIAHMISYTYINILLACAVGLIGNLKELIQTDSNSVV